MKKSILKASIIGAAFLTLFCFGFKPVAGDPQKINICHMPPGNTDNCQEISISVNAFETHITHHDDALVCHNQAEHEFYKVLAKRSNMRLVTTFEAVGTTIE